MGPRTVEKEERSLCPTVRQYRLIINYRIVSGQNETHCNGIGRVTVGGFIAYGDFFQDTEEDFFGRTLSPRALLLLALLTQLSEKYIHRKVRSAADKTPLHSTSHYTKNSSTPCRKKPFTS